jgi:hypothetical protein
MTNQTTIRCTVNANAGLRLETDSPTTIRLTVWDDYDTDSYVILDADSAVVLLRALLERLDVKMDS